MDFIATRSVSFLLVDSRYTGKASYSEDHVRVVINIIRVSRVILACRLQENNFDILFRIVEKAYEMFYIRVVEKHAETFYIRIVEKTYGKTCPILRCLSRVQYSVFLTIF